MDAAGVEKLVLSPHWPPYLPSVTREKVLVRHRVLRLESGLYLRTRSLWGRPSRHRQRLSGIAGLRDLQQDYETYKETFAYIERLALPRADVEKILHHNAEALFGFRH